MKQIKQLQGKYLSRKLLVLLILFIFATIFMVFGIGDTSFSGWSQFALVLYGLYIGGNVGSQLISKSLTQKKYEDNRYRYKNRYDDEDQQAL